MHMSGINITELRRHYQNEALDLEHLDKNPFLQFKDWFDAAVKALEIEPNAMALATADKSAIPSLRMVLLKGIEHEAFIFYTNYQSRKGLELDANPHAALLFWWQTLERQVRIEGVVERVPEEMSDEYFASRPLGSQIGSIVSPQSRPISDYTELADGFEQVQKEYMINQQLARPKHWGGYMLIPQAIEFWQGRENRLHDRFRYEKSNDGTWKIDRLAP
jgi:pyridoxamine 5'-phosphate oxidase